MALRPVSRSGRCSVCRHPEAVEVDRAIVSGESYAEISRRFGLGRDSVRRHNESGHVIEAIAAAGEAAEVAHGDSILERLRELETRASSILDQAQRGRNHSTALQAIRELRAILELFARLTAELEPDGGTVILADPAWIAIRGRILLALDAHPEARAAVIAALSAGEDS